MMNYLKSASQPNRMPILPLCLAGITALMAFQSMAHAAPRLIPVFLNLDGETVVASAVATSEPWKADSTAHADSTEAIQKALDDVAAQGGGVVFLPAGRYRLDGSLKIGYAVTLRGAGGDPDGGLLPRSTILEATGAPGDEPLLDVTAHEGAVIGLSVWYPQQAPDDPIAYPFTIRASGATLRDIGLLDSYNGVELQDANTCVVDHVVGTVLHRGLTAPHSTEFSWIRSVHFANHYWRDAAAELGGGRLSSETGDALDRFTRANLVGLELGRIDGMVLDGFSAEDAAIAIRIKKDTHENQNRVFGFGGVVRDFRGPREEFGWDGWYYGMHYANVDNVPEANALAYSPAPIPGPLRHDADSILDVTRPPYTAAGDGHADDTTAIQGALDASGRAGGGTVYLPPGEYRITRPLMVPRGVELRGPLGSGKARAYRRTCALAADFGGDSPHPETEPALLTLEEFSGVRGFEIFYPGQPFDAARIRPYPYAVRGHGAHVWIMDVLLVNAYLGIDLATYRCDDHLVSGVWGTALLNGIQVGAGSHGGRLERVAFSYGPWAESWLLTPADRERTEGIAAYHRQHAVHYRFGDCSGETGWGLVGFNPSIHMQFYAQNDGVCTNATFWLSLFDVANKTLLQMDAGENIRFFGLWGTGGGGDPTSNWLEVGKDFQGPLDITAKTIQPTFVNHPMTFRPDQVHFHDERSLTDGRAATASTSLPGHGPDLAVDRDPRTFWRAPAGSWLQVDLGRLCTIDRFGIESAGLFGDHRLNTVAADLYLSEDGKTFRRAATLQTNGAAWSSRPIEPTQARYVRLVVTHPGADGVIRVASFDVDGSGRSPTGPTVDAR